jgi:hypothetical protein
MHPDGKRPRLKPSILRLFWSQSPHAGSCSKILLVYPISIVPSGPHSAEGLLEELFTHILIIYSSLHLFQILSDHR